jgi:hypothetical protein
MKNASMSPAALVAALSGNMENFIAASTEGGIEAQEKRGQLRQAQMQTLPIDLGRGDEGRKQFESLGFVFGEKVDALFVSVKFPEGWRKQPTDHSMWSDIVDANGNKRGAIFYKAAFYDQKAHASLTRRFSVSRTYDDGPVSVFVKDELGIVKHEITGLAGTSGKQERAELMAAYDAIDLAESKVRNWLKENYPDCDSPLAYWSA